jgi:excisionase family DNA binding protein
MDLLTVKEAAQMTRMSASWWRQRVFRREIEYLKIGRSVRIPKATVDQVLERSLVQERRPVKA